MSHSELTFLHCTHNPAYDSVHPGKRFPDFHALQLSAGDVQLRYDRRRHRMNGVWLWSVFPGPIIAFQVAPGSAHWEHRYVGFVGPRVEWWEGQGLWPLGPVSVPEESAPQVIARFDELLTCVRSTHRFGRLRAIHLLESILLDFATLQEPTQPEMPWLDRVLKRLSTPELLDPDYASIASDAGMSLRTLRRRFKEAVGLPLHEYVVRNRMTAAREMLGETAIPVKLVAQRLGYCDVQFFTRQFRKHVGVTPAAYRRSSHC